MDTERAESPGGKSAPIRLPRLNLAFYHKPALVGPKTARNAIAGV